MKRIYMKIGVVLYVILLPIIRIVIRRTTRVHVAITNDCKVLLVKNWLARDTWRLPGGGVHKSERPESAAVREVREELGIELDESKLIQLDSGIMGVDRLGYRYISFAYDLDDQPYIKSDAFEIIEYSFFTTLPPDAQAGLSDVVLKLKEEKLL